MRKLFFLLPFVFFLQTRIPLGRRFYANDYEMFFLYIRDIVVVAFCVAVLLHHRQEFAVWVKSLGWKLWWILGLIAFSFLSVVMALDPLLATVRSVNLAVYAFFALCVGWYSTTHKITTTWWYAWVVGCFTVGVLAVFEVLFGHSLGVWILGNWDYSVVTPAIARATFLGKTFLRPYAVFPHPNVLGGVAAVWLLLFAWRYLKGKNGSVLLGFGISWLLVIISFSRSVWLGVFIAGLWCAVLLRKTIPFSRIFLGGIVLSLLIIIPYILTLSTNDPSVTERRELLQRSIQIINTHPLTGVGNGNFSVALKAYRTAEQRLLLQPVHNVPLLVMSEIGIVAGIWFLGGWLLLMRDIWNTPRSMSKVFIIGIWIVISVTSLFDHYWWSLSIGNGMVWLVVGFTICAIAAHDTSRASVLPSSTD